ncbi:hypothetical protein GF373_17325 [bacterium]|nr:hypothetical protein [bacterium]
MEEKKESFPIAGKKTSRRLPNGQFRPSPAMERLLNADLDPFDPPATLAERAARANVSTTTIRNWGRDPAFREWYHRAFRAGAYAFTTTGISELVRLIRDPKASSNAKVSGINTLLSKFDKERAVESKNAALKALIDALAPGKENDLKMDLAIEESENGGLRLAGQVSRGGRPVKEAEGDWLPPELVVPPDEVESGPAPIPDPPVLENEEKDGNAT